MSGASRGTSSTRTAAPTMPIATAIRMLITLTSTVTTRPSSSAGVFVQMYAKSNW
jgi:hypothetical protein